MKYFQKLFSGCVCVCVHMCACVRVWNDVAFKMLRGISHVMNCTYMAEREPNVLRKKFFRIACGYTYELQDIIPLHF
jgi:hypothetical protein